MRFRFRNGRGKVVPLPDVASLLDAIRSGAVGPETSLAIGSERVWHRAESVAAYREAIAALGQQPIDRLPAPIASAEPRSPWKAISRKPRLLVALALGSILLVGFGVRGYFAPGRSRAPAPAKARLSITGLRAGAQLNAFSYQFGDSVALELRRLQDWLAGQGFAARLRGAALKNPGSLRAARAAGAGLLLRVDSIASRSGELAWRMVARAEALEGAGQGASGLATALEDELAVWSREFAAEFEILRGLAAAMDSLPAYLLQKPNSFAVWEGSAAFLSRDDGGRFAALEARFAELAVQEQVWSSRLLARRPEWMGGVLEDERPRFGLPLLASR